MIDKFLKLTPGSYLSICVREVRPAIFGALVLTFTITICSIAPAIYLRQVLDRVMMSRNETTLFFLFLIVIFFIVIWTTLETLRNAIFQRVSNVLHERVSIRLFDKVSKLSSRRDPTERARHMADLDVFRDFLASPIVGTMCEVLFTPLFVLVIAILSPISAGVLLIMMIMIAGLSVGGQFVATKPISEAQLQVNKAAAFLAAVVRGSDTARALGMVPVLAKQWNTHQVESLNWQAEARRRARVFNLLLRLLRHSIQVIFVTVGVLLFLNNLITPGTIIAIMLLSYRAIGPIDHIAQAYKAIWNFLQATRRLDVLLDLPEEPKMIMGPPVGGIKAFRLTCISPTTGESIISGVSFSCLEGEIMGVIGSSGAGKSTLARAVVGLSRPDSGKVTLGDRDMYHWELDELGKHLGYVSQEVHLFRGTVADNIMRFSQSENSTALMKAVRVSRISSLLEKLPLGLSTVIGPGGYALSGGQQQRIAIARAVFGDPHLLVLDEPNSASDLAGERELTEMLLELRSLGKTVIVITHRQDLLLVCDKILALNSGSVQAFGSRADLMARITPTPLRSIK